MSSRGRKPRSLKEPNHLLRLEREKRGWSQSRLAGEIGTDSSTVSRWERGERGVDFVFQEKLCLLFGKDAIELGFTHLISASNVQLETPQIDEIEAQDMNKSRRDFIKEAVSIALWERLSAALKKPAYVDETLITELKNITESYWSMRANISSHSLLKNVTSHLDSIIELLQYSYTEEIRKPLCSLAGTAAQLLGQMAFDMKDHTSAREYYKVSIEAAQEANDAALYASALGRMSFLFLENNQPEETLTLLEKSHKLAKLSATNVTSAWLFAIEAEAYASMNSSSNQTTACLKALDQAEQAINQTATTTDPYKTGFNRSRLAGYKGVCFVRLNQPEAAISSLNEALSTAGYSSLRRRSRILTDIATAYVLQAEVEEGCKFAHQALDLTQQTKSAMVLQRIHKFRTHVEPWREVQAVKDLDQKLLFF
jgi:transcriptional regulator with XRE-family HTH domain